MCKAGVAGAGAGALSAFSNTGGAFGIAVDQTTGALYVSDKTNRRVDVFSATGVFQGAIGWNVNSAAPAEEVQFCTTATGCKAGVAGAAAGQLSNLEVSGLAVDPRNGDLYVSDLGNLRLAEYAIAVNGEAEVTGATFLRATGWKVSLAAPADELQECTTLTGCQKGTAGAGAGQFRKENPGPIAVDSSGYIYAVNVKYSGNCSAAEPCRILKFNPDGSFKEVFGPTSGECQVTYTSGAATTEEAFDVAIDRANNHVLLARKVGTAGEFRVLDFDEDGTSCAISPPAASLAGTTSVVSHGLAAGIESRVYAGMSGEVFVLGQTPVPAVEFEEVTGVTATTATFTGFVTPPAEFEGNRFETRWRFEYSTDQSHWTKLPTTDGNAGSIPEVPVSVEATTAELAPNTHYFVRLCATTGPTVCDPSPAQEFSTGTASPTIYETYAESVSQTSAILAARINPNSSDTSYFFEWGPTSAYGFRTPSFDRSIGAGGQPIIVREQLPPLSPISEYHFRLVASNASGPTVGPDQAFMTLNSSGLPDNRIPELVSPAKGPLGTVFEKIAINSAQLRVQVDPGGVAAAFEVGYGNLGSTTGGEVVYRSARGDAGWSSPNQLSPPLTGDSQINFNVASQVVYLSGDLQCGFVSTASPLTPDTPERAGQEDEKAANLYQEGPDGSFTLVTDRSPIAFGATPGIFTIVGASPDCNRVLFETTNQYEGLAVGSLRELYEWEEGVLRHVGFVPGTAGEVAVAAAVGDGVNNYWNAVSRDGARVIFTAASQNGPDQGKQALFLRQFGSPTLDISQSQTATVSEGITYQTASTDASKVFFTAKAGLTSTSSVAGTDLYEYDLGRPAGERLVDLSADRNPADSAGAAVAGVVAASDDGEYVYFVAAGQLVTGKGRSYVENLAAQTYNLYLAHAGATEYVGALTKADLPRALVENSSQPIGNRSWMARVTPDGSNFLFESSWNLTGLESGGVPEAYLYTAKSPGSPASSVCISCRRDGRPSMGSGSTIPLATGSAYKTVTWLHPPRNLSVDGARAFFEMPDALAPGAIEGARNIYEWEDGQVYLLASEVEASPPAQLERRLLFAGASERGDDAFLITSKQLSPQDGDGRRDLYDLRVGGRFPAAQPPPSTCDALLEGACQGAPPATPAPATPVTPSFNGPGNPAPPAKHKKKHKKHHHKKKAHRTGKAKKHGSSKHPQQHSQRGGRSK